MNTAAMNPIGLVTSSPLLATRASRLYGAVCRRLNSLETVPGEQHRLITRVSGGVDEDRAGREIYLTFDDGPGLATPGVLAQLESRGVAASFFFTGSALNSWSESSALLSQLEAGGHTIGLHGYDHLNAWTTGRRKVETDQKKGLDTILRRTSVEWARPPYGRLTPALYRWYRSNDLKIALWDVDPADYSAHRAGRTRDDVIGFIIRSVRPGSVVLLHENRRVWDRDLSHLFERLEYEGWQLAALPLARTTAGKSDIRIETQRTVVA